MKNKTEQPLKHELLLMIDAFAEHTCFSSFVLHALTAIMSSEDPLSPEVIEGAKRCAEMLQSRTWELKQSLSHAYERYLAEHGRDA